MILLLPISLLTTNVKRKEMYWKMINSAKIATVYMLARKT